MTIHTTTEHTTTDTVGGLPPQVGHYVSSLNYSGWWLGQDFDDVTAEEPRQAAVLDSSGSVVRVPLNDLNRHVDPYRTRLSVADVASALLLERLAHDGTKGEHERTKNKHEQFRERVTEMAHEEANERDYCPEFDDFMERVGLPRRSRDFDVRVTINITATISGETYERAIESVDDETVRGWINDDNNSLDYDIEEY